MEIPITPFRKNLLDRAHIKMNCDSSLEHQEAAMELCNRDIGYFFDYFAWTYDQRRTPSDLPFMLYPYQDQYIHDLSEDIEKGESELIEKTRDMGVTWMVLTVFVYHWLFRNQSFLVGSIVESKVDTIGDMDSHFERMRYIISKLPAWMLAKCDYNSKNSSYMRLYKDNGASITGESMSPQFSRQGRYKSILLDEFAFIAASVTVWRACGDSSPCKIVVSTPNGSNNKFAMLRKSGQIKVKTFHWKLHPRKDDAWYAKEKEKRSAKDVAQELDINYTISAGDPFYIGFSRGIHLRKMNISRDKPLDLSWDYGFRHPNCTIHQLSVEGIWIVVDNIFGENQTIDEFAEAVKSYLNANYAGYQWNHKGYGDPAGRQSSDKSKLSSEQILNDFGFKVISIPSNSKHSSYASRKAIIEKRLRTLIGGIPSLVINDVPNNQIIVEGFEGGYRNPDANKYGGITEKPVEDGWYEHPMNCVEYYGINMFKPVDFKPKVQSYQPDIMAKKRKERELVNAGMGY